MTNTWTKNGDAWAVQSPTQQAPGTVVTVTNRKGEQKTVTLGEQVAATRWGFVYAVAPDLREPRREAQVGKVDGILALFDRTAKRLKFPAMELTIPETGTLLRVNVAGARAKVPGSLTITGARQEGTGERPWYGRILRDGTFQPAREAPAGIAERLAQFAAEPARIAAEHGKLTGRCCFCRLGLTRGESTEVGYGKDCAANWGLPWGKPKATRFGPPALGTPTEAEIEAESLLGDDTLETVADTRPVKAREYTESVAANIEALKAAERKIDLSDGTSDDRPFDPAFDR